MTNIFIRKDEAMISHFMEHTGLMVFLLNFLLHIVHFIIKVSSSF